MWRPLRLLLGWRCWLLLWFRFCLGIGGMKQFPTFKSFQFRGWSQCRAFSSVRHCAPLENNIFSILRSRVSFCGIGSYGNIGQISPFLAGVAFASRQLVSVPWGVLTMRRLLGLSTSRQVLCAAAGINRDSFNGSCDRSCTLHNPNGHLAV